MAIAYVGSAHRTISCGHVGDLRLGPGLSSMAAKHGGRCPGEDLPTYRAWMRGKQLAQQIVTAA